MVETMADSERKARVSRARRAAGAGMIAALLAVVATLPASTGAATTSAVRAPKDGEYSTVVASLYVSGKSLELVALRFACDGAFGGTALNAVQLKKSSVGYRFAIKAHGNVSYSDDHPDENAAIGFSGRFSKSGKRAMGRFRVRPPRCGDTGNVEWTAKKR
jgi:hypothetical protein